ncbi:MAG TPA: phosphoribosyltransferase family protein, partial [Chthonomonadales bacterium]|nr:phosphoribosyltransferase family protein [Chthonomonadales bacterium]
MGLSQSQARELFEEVDALRTGHFSLTSGRHSGEYWEKFWILQWPSRVELLCGEIAGRFRGKGIETVLGPTTGGILLAFEIARQLEVRALYAEMENGKRTLRRGLGLSAGERALVVDDVTTTSGSLKECIDLVRSYEAIVAG